ncbi:hypothetical protein OHB44_20660 [Micromonospora sp. NBC_00821]|uniref:hypothetical protein n=1 Tax=Micromonospora sp. NBC_00821 TaxID=2975977 RepID=UPI002ED6BEBC|nr:hypothetical protein OHB44_20660 [Micromonospora sp. NBC_00821]
MARALPDPPQTPLFHVHLPIGPDAAMRAADALLAANGVKLFGRVRSAPAPDRCSSAGGPPRSVSGMDGAYRAS